MVKNDSVSGRPPLRKCGYILTALALVLLIDGCGHTNPPHLISDNPTLTSAPPSDPRTELAGLAAAAQDRKYVAAYTLTTDGQADRTVLVSLAADGSTRVDVPSGALSGGANVSMVSNSQGTYQCVLGGPATTFGTAPAASPSPSPSASIPPVTRWSAPACVKVAEVGARVPNRYDQTIAHLFSDWLDVMTDQDAPILVFEAAPLPHSTGTCYSVEPSSASIAPPMQAGIFCYEADGTLSAAALAHNRIVINGNPAPAPPGNPLPGPISAGPAAPNRAP